MSTLDAFAGSSFGLGGILDDATAFGSDDSGPTPFGHGPLAGFSEDVDHTFPRTQAPLWGSPGDMRAGADHFESLGGGDGVFGDLLGPRTQDSPCGCIRTQGHLPTSGAELQRSSGPSPVDAYANLGAAETGAAGPFSNTNASTELHAEAAQFFPGVPAMPQPAAASEAYDADDMSQLFGERLNMQGPPIGATHGYAAPAAGSFGMPQGLAPHTLPQYGRESLGPTAMGILRSERVQRPQAPPGYENHPPNAVRGCPHMLPKGGPLPGPPLNFAAPPPHGPHYGPHGGRIAHSGNAWASKRHHGHQHKGAGKGHTSSHAGVGGYHHSSAASTASNRSSSIASEDGDELGGRGGGVVGGEDRHALQDQVSQTAERILQAAAGGSLKAVELANTLRSRLGTDTLSAIRKQFGGLLTLLESQPDAFVVRRIPKSDIVTLRYPRRPDVPTPAGGVTLGEQHPIISRTPSPGVTLIGHPAPMHAGGHGRFQMAQPQAHWMGARFDRDGPQGSLRHPQSGSSTPRRGSYEYYGRPGPGVQDPRANVCQYGLAQPGECGGSGYRQTPFFHGGPRYEDPRMRQGPHTCRGGPCASGATYHREANRAQTAGPGHLSEELVEALTVETMVPTQAWAANASRDFPFVTAVVDTLDQLGATATISKLRGHLKHRLHLSRSVKTVPLKALMRAYPQYFKVNGNTAALRMPIDAPTAMGVAPMRIQSPGPSMRLHYVHQ